MLSRILNWWRWQMLTPEEQYLLKSTDIFDLERRQKKLWDYKINL